MLTLKITDGASEFRPGQRVEGVASWEVPDPPDRVVLRLFWYTEGRGTQDVEVVEEQALPALSSRGEERFTFTLPAAPYSFSGKLISLLWAIELVVGNDQEVARVDFQMSPWGRGPVLGTAAPLETSKSPVHVGWHR